MRPVRRWLIHELGMLRMLKHNMTTFVHDIASCTLCRAQRIVEKPARERSRQVLEPVPVETRGSRRELHEPYEQGRPFC